MEEEAKTQCKMCGRVPGPFEGCNTCGGRAEVEPRTYTLSEIRSGRAPKEDRTGETKPLGPKTSSPFWFST